MNELIVQVCDGDVLKYDQMKRLSVIEFLLIFEKYVKDIEQEQKQQNGR